MSERLPAGSLSWAVDSTSIHSKHVDGLTNLVPAAPGGFTHHIPTPDEILTLQDEADIKRIVDRLTAGQRLNRPL
jgi:hypothetical protein